MLSNYLKVDPKETLELKEKMFANNVKGIGIKGTSFRRTASRGTKRPSKEPTPAVTSSPGISAIEITSRIGAADLQNADNSGCSRRTLDFDIDSKKQSSNKLGFKFQSP